MTNKFSFKIIDKSLKGIISKTNNSSKRVFRGKVIVLGNDFRQILHVIPINSISDLFMLQ